MLLQSLWTIYHPEIPPFLRPYLDTPPLTRLRDVGMNCGCEYTSFPLFLRTRPYSRFDHSVGTALIIWHFTGSPRQTVAGLLHDTATPVFAHVVDFLNGDHLRQESTEERTEDFFRRSPELTALLRRDGLTMADVADYHRYPIADNPSPQLSADRLEYTLGNLWHYGFLDLAPLKDFYRDLTVGTNENGDPELAFRSPETALAFAQAALRTSRVYVANEDRFAMQTLAETLRDALNRCVLTGDDLYTTEPEVIEKLRADSCSAGNWDRFRGLSRLQVSSEKPEEPSWLSIPAKKRYIDPLVLEKGRISRLSPETRAMQADFLALDFSVWLRAAE